MKKIIIKILINKVAAQRIIETDGKYTEKDIKKIFKEIHPEWNIVDICDYVEIKNID